MSIEFEGKKSVITPEGVFIIGTYDENGTPQRHERGLGHAERYGRNHPDAVPA